ncbi:hypothetical protein ABTM42_20130, partial [Acinetobacter baumannii]
EFEGFYISNICQQTQLGGSLRLSFADDSTDGGCAPGAAVTVTQYTDNACQNLAQTYNIGIGECGGPDQIQVQCGCDSDGNFIGNASV